MGKQKYILNNTYGINGIEKISLKEIMKIFSVPIHSLLIEKRI